MASLNWKEIDVRRSKLEEKEVTNIGKEICFEFLALLIDKKEEFFLKT